MYHCIAIYPAMMIVAERSVQRSADEFHQITIANAQQPVNREAADATVR